MKWFYDLRTMAKLGVSFAVMVVLLAAVGWVSVSVAAESNAALDILYRRDMAGVDVARRAQVQRVMVARSYLYAMLEKDEKARDAHVREFEHAESSFLKLIDELDPLTYREDQKARLVEAKRAMTAYGGAARAVMETMKTDPDKGLEGLKASSALGVRVAEVLDEYVKVKWEITTATRAATEADYTRGRGIALALTLAAIALATIMAYVVGRSIAAPLNASVAVLERVAQGDLSARLDVDRRDELGVMASALNNSLDSIRNTLAGVRDVSAEVSSVSSQLAASAEQISDGAQSQAASLEETAASLEEISATVKHNTDSAQQAAKLARSACDTAEHGGQVVERAVAAMNAITTSSTKIADIITTIDEIAFQTNLLALNAAVEAARAGEQGRGFAVVAAEVRGLAQRTGSAAKEIRVLIADSSSKVEAGTKQVHDSGRSLEEIVDSVKRVTDMIASIAAASREQSTGVDQVNVAVNQVDQVTQRNAAQTEELSATATVLSDRSSELRTLVAAFQLGARSHETPSRSAGAADHEEPQPHSRAHARSGTVRTSKPSSPSRGAAGGFGGR